VIVLVEVLFTLLNFRRRARDYNVEIFGGRRVRRLRRPETTQRAHPHIKLHMGSTRSFSEQ
jgi:hypothetical protein